MRSEPRLGGTGWEGGNADFWGWTFPWAGNSLQEKTAQMPGGWSKGKEREPEGEGWGLAPLRRLLLLLGHFYSAEKAHLGLLHRGQM